MGDALTALDQAIQKYVGEATEGGFAESWIVVAHSQQVDDADAVSGYRIITSDSQPHHVDLGLIQVGKEILESSWDSYQHDPDE